MLVYWGDSRQSGVCVVQKEAINAPEYSSNSVELLMRCLIKL